MTQLNQSEEDFRLLRDSEMAVNQQNLPLVEEMEKIHTLGYKNKIL